MQMDGIDNCVLHTWTDMLGWEGMWLQVELLLHVSHLGKLEPHLTVLRIDVYSL